MRPPLSATIRTRCRALPLLFGLLVFAAPAVAQTGEIDFEKARELRQRMQRGEQLTPEERDFLERARAEIRRQQKGGRGRPGAAVPAPRESIGLTPLDAMGPPDRYKGQEGGLYGEGRNQPPEGHMKAALRAASEIRPLDAEGRPAADGTIGLISVGMSNTTQEYRAFMALANRDEEKSPRVVLVDGAQGGMDSLAWADPAQRARGDRPNPWDVLDQRLQQAGVSPAQVQVAWIKQARMAPASLGEFPAHAETLHDDIAVIVRKLKDRFPNLRLAYLSGRIYAGYASTPLNPEPYAYESAFAVRRLLRDQIEGKPGLNPDPDKGEVEAPVLLWGPYLWADGMAGRPSDDLVWRREDLAGDGTHPSPSGQRKVAELLLDFFKADPTATGWFLAKEAGAPSTSGTSPR